MATLLPTVLAIVSLACGCQRESHTGAAVYSIAFGQMRDDGTISSDTRTIKYEVGTAYGWQLTVTSTSCGVRVREVFRLPASATWPDIPGDPPEGISAISRKVSSDKRTKIEEFDLECSQTRRITVPYSIIEGDPKGEHEISLYLDGQLIEEIDFVIE